jgi:ribonucleoside-diphosphate reductase beta chain
MSVFELHNQDFTKSTMFFGPKVNIARYDKQKYPQFEKLTEQQQGFFWRPQEVDCSKDIKDFKTLSDAQKHIFTSNLKRQILLDSVQGRAPVEAFLPICSLPEIENWLITWSFFETIHSRSYTHIIRNVYSDPSKVFDEMLDVKEIADCAQDISKYYDDLIDKNVWKSDWRADKPYSGSNKIENEYNHKKALWLCLNAVNALEGIRFYVSFACSWAFAELKQMEGNAKIIKFIARDENVHLASTQQMLKLLPKDDPDFVKIKEDCAEEVGQMFNMVIQQEKDWAKYLFQGGSMIGLNEELLCDYVDWIANKRMLAIGLTPSVKGVKSNPLPWTQKWIGGSEVQTAPQEVEISQYIIGGLKKDVDTTTFSDMSL